MIIITPKPPYYVVIFNSILIKFDPEYFRINDFLRHKAEKLDGFLVGIAREMNLELA